MVEKANIIARVKERHAQAGRRRASLEKERKVYAALPVGYARDNIRKTAKDVEDKLIQEQVEIRQLATATVHAELSMIKAVKAWETRRETLLAMRGAIPGLEGSGRNCTPRSSKELGFSSLGLISIEPGNEDIDSFLSVLPSPPQGGRDKVYEASNLQRLEIQAKSNAKGQTSRLKQEKASAGHLSARVLSPASRQRTAGQERSLVFKENKLGTPPTLKDSSRPPSLQ